MPARFAPLNTLHGLRSARPSSRPYAFVSQRRSMSSSPPTSSYSAFVWQAGGALMVLGGVALLLNPSRPLADPKAAAADPLSGKPPTNPVDPEVAASINRSLEADAPKVAKVAEESSPSSSPTSDSSSVKGSLHQAIIADSPIDARNAEAMSAPNGVQDGIKQAMNSDIPNMAKKQEEKSSTDAGASLQQALKADIPKAAKKAEEGVSA